MKNKAINLYINPFFSNQKNISTEEECPSSTRYIPVSKKMDSKQSPINQKEIPDLPNNEAILASMASVAEHLRANEKEQAVHFCKEQLDLYKDLQIFESSHSNSEVDIIATNFLTLFNPGILEDYNQPLKVGDKFQRS